MRGLDLHGQPQHLMGKTQEAVNVVEKWSYSWGFKFSIEKTKSVMFTSKSGVDAQIKMYGQSIEQVKVIRFLGVWFDTKLT